MAQGKFSHLFFSLVTFSGTPFFYVPAIIYLWMTVNSPSAIMLSVAMILVEVSGAAIKLIYPTERPVPMPRNTLYQKYDAGSFPSIHTARITATMAFIGAAHLNLLVLSVGLLLSFLVGYSRVCLKKHRISDVVAGFAMGILFSFGVLLVMR